MNKINSLSVSCLLCVFLTGNAHALDDQWYIGAGGGASWLQPNPDDIAINVDERLGQTGTIFIGRDLDNLTSTQLQFSALGEATLDNGDEVLYADANAALLYRFFDSRDYKLIPEGFGAALYGKFALGFLHRDSTLSLSNDALVYFGAGAGIEVFITRHISARGEAFYHESDAATATLSLVARFGGGQRPTAFPAPSPAPAPDATLTAPAPTIPTPAADATSESAKADTETKTDTAIDNNSGLGVNVPDIPVPPLLPVVPPVIPVIPSESTAVERESVDTTPQLDSDGDGIADADDVCARSARGYPVLENGCALFDGVLQGVKFVEGSAELLPEAFVQLDYLANVLLDYPLARIELQAHTDTLGDVIEQSRLTRARLRSMGRYLVQKGVSAKRLHLRSFGGSRPMYNSRNPAGRVQNNRIEIIEHVN